MTDLQMALNENPYACVEQITVNGIKFTALGDEPYDLPSSRNGIVEIFDVKGTKVAKAELEGSSEQLLIEADGEESAINGGYWDFILKTPQERTVELGSYLAGIL